MPQVVESGAVSSLVGLVIQCAGIALLAVLCVFLARSVERVFASYWAAAWGCLVLALGSLYWALTTSPRSTWNEVSYYLGEYAFGFFLIAGFRNFATGARLGPRDAWASLPAATAALALPHVAESFSVRFMVQSFVLACLFAAALVQLERARRRRGTTPGMRLTAVALAVLFVSFLQYPPLLYASAVGWVTLPIAYSGYTSIYDLILEVLLGFGMVTLAMEDVHQEMEAANRELRSARDRLEAAARMDPLTQSLNRHAFYSLVEEERTDEAPSPTGTVVVLDLDDLKAVNDSLGHAAGDMVIRAVASALRSLVRADDLVFRWGGDEFLAILFNLSEVEAQRRFEALGGLLSKVPVPGSVTAVEVSVSFGLAAFSAEHPIEKAIDAADAAMYLSKQDKKARKLSQA
jgi:diguanylate cyclase (GGDEF)-like protein